MVIDFDNIAEERVIGFKGGHGELLTRNYNDGKCKIMKSCLRPGASSGLHKHEGNSEIVYIISGTATINLGFISAKASMIILGEGTRVRKWR